MLIYLILFEEAGPDHARRGAGTSIFGAYLRDKNFILPSCSTVLASGASRRDPPRRVDVIIQMFIKI